MNNSKMWLVVKPTVGIPIFLSAVAIGSFAVHVAVLTNTSWVSDFLSGQELGSGDAQAAAAKAADTVMPAAHFAPDGSTAPQVYVMMPDGTLKPAVLEAPGAILASADNRLPPTH